MEEIMQKETSQLSSIFKVIGTPTPEECASVRNPKLRANLLARPAVPRKSFKDIFPFGSDADVHILNASLQFDPKRRKRYGQKA